MLAPTVTADVRWPLFEVKPVELEPKLDRREAFRAREECHEPA